jgi:hypothetical protein
LIVGAVRVFDAGGNVDVVAHSQGIRIAVEQRIEGGQDGEVEIVAIASTNHRLPVADRIIGESHARAEIFDGSVCLLAVEKRHDSLEECECRAVVLVESDATVIVPTQSKIQSQLPIDLPVVLSEDTDSLKVVDLEYAIADVVEDLIDRG